MPKRTANSILVVGSINTDLVVHVEKYPAPGETVPGFGFSTFSGGKGANQAVAAARLGASVTIIGATGDDPLAKERRADLEKEGINLTYVQQVPDCPTGVAVITVQNAENRIIVAPGANGRLTRNDVRNCEAAFEEAAVVLLQLETTLEAVQAAVELGKKHHAHVLLNPAPVPLEPLPREILSLVDDLIPNQTELANIARQPQDVPLLEALQSLPSTFRAKRIIVTLGEDGALISDPSFPSYPRRLPSYHVTPIDTTAAGDAFIGAYAVALSEGKNSEEAVEFALAAGAFAVTKPGAQPSLPTRQELEEFIKTARRRTAP